MTFALSACTASCMGSNCLCLCRHSFYCSEHCAEFGFVVAMYILLGHSCVEELLVPLDCEQCFV